jgi:glycosyltransferase involved in cell wall biosynthesis
MDHNSYSKHPILTIGIVTYNRTDYLSKMLDSIIKIQSEFTNQIEILILNNGSSDGTSALLDSYKDRVEFKLIQQKENMRGAETFKKLINSASGKFMIIPGDDDCFYGENFDKLLAVLRAIENDVNIVTCFADVIDEKDRLLSVNYRPVAHNTQENILAQLIFKSIFWLPATVFRREILAKKDLSPSLIALDWSFWIETMSNGKYFVLDTPIIKYRQHSNREQESYLQKTWDIDSFLMLEKSVTVGSLKNWFDAAETISLNLFAQELVTQTKNKDLKDLELAIYILICQILHRKINIRLLLLNLYENPNIKLDPRFTQTAFGINLTLQELDSIFNSIGAVLSYSGNNFKGTTEDKYLILKELNGTYSYEWKVGKAQKKSAVIELNEVIGAGLEVYGLIQRDCRSEELKSTLSPFESTVIYFLRKIRKIKYGRKLTTFRLKLRK